MDSSLLKTVLESQERAYKAAIEVMVKQMNDHINKLEGTVSDLRTSLEYTQREVDELKSANKEYEKERKDANMKIDKLIEQVESSNEKIKKHEDRINYQEDYSRRKNVRIVGVEERSANETWEQTATTVTSLLQDKMQLDGVALERAHRVGPRRDTKPRAIVARFSRYCDREAVMRSAGKLKGTNIFVDDDLCPASQAVKNAQMPQLKQAKAQGKTAFFRHTRLIIKERHNDAAAAGQGRQSLEVAGEGAASAQRQRPAGDAVAVGDTPPDASSGAQTAANAGGVFGVAVAGAWSDRRKDSSSLPTPRPDDSISRSHPQSTPSTSSQRKQEKKTLRSSVKK